MERRRTVLVVDDQPHIRMLMTAVLTTRDLDVICAPDGRQALELVKARRPGVVLLDWVMPGMGGEEFLLRLQEVDPYVPVLLITGSAEGPDTSRHPRVSDFLAKPFDVWELASRVERLLSSR
ncbi:MAG TPA: response regulator [Bacillota bacterium]|nr:response regulator [Bacillota bacterium]